MRLDDFINFKILEDYDDDIPKYLLKCPKDKNHKIINCIEDNPPINKSEILYLIKQARLSFLTHIKLKDKYMHNLPELCEQNDSDISLEKVFYLSGDKKYYCFYFCIDYLYASETYFFGILDKEIGNYLIMCCVCGLFYVKNNFFDINNCEDLDCMENIRMLNFIPILLSEETDEDLSDKSKPLEIIDTLEDYFCTMYEELYKI
ncbi:hypothetical protein H012_gp855 [Acanthamoeba polyphaga moumouvirus]|uniref:Uncharacterized protein n=2 Tax=Moumouvirus TaxID=3080801 RepID=L7RBU1_9VIRU|nr:hypothetical protein H012_gp855 [Acanthamoeba polyphaga moumouvirus]AEX63257.1 hypothetical protein mv_R1055 [Moumouvirus Monve]AGC01611.1 hypothetical protein Moumou_00063 [Acanthamoeba polyphaga moumouvirus]AQN67936.1 hypothetical protein [Saudi moumouvirus]